MCLESTPEDSNQVGQRWKMESFEKDHQVTLLCTWT